MKLKKIQKSLGKHFILGTLTMNRGKYLWSVKVNNEIRSCGKSLNKQTAIDNLQLFFDNAIERVVSFQQSIG